MRQRRLTTEQMARRINARIPWREDPAQVDLEDLLGTRPPKPEKRQADFLDLLKPQEDA